jgi:TolA-binding protein
MPAFRGASAVASTNVVVSLRALAYLAAPFFRPMKTERNLISIAAAVALAFASFPVARAQLPTPEPQKLDAQRLNQGKQQFDAAAYADAIKTLETIQRDFPTSELIANANLLLGLCYLSTNQFDQGVVALRKNLAIKTPVPEIIEDSQALIPQLLSAKGQRLPVGDPARKAALEMAVTEFQNFTQKFPQSTEVEQANLGKAIALNLLERWEEAGQALRTNVEKFPNSESALDTKYMLALVEANRGSDVMRKKSPPGEDKAADAAFDEAEKLLREIVARQTDLMLMNDAQFELGEMLAVRAGFTPAGERQDMLLLKALDAYRGTYPRDRVINAQKIRIATYKNQSIEAVRKGDNTLYRRLQKLAQYEQNKLALLEQREDQTLEAKLKSGRIYLMLHKDKERERMDEARVLFRFVENFTQDSEQKKQVLYNITLTYAAQRLTEKAEEYYAKWIASFKDDPMGENLPLLMGKMYVEKDPDKALKYFEKLATDFPKSEFIGLAAIEKAMALIGIKRFDEAEKVLQDFLKTNPSKEQAAGADFALAVLYKDTNKIDQSVEAFRKVRNVYAGTEQAEQSGYWVGQLLYAKGDAKGAVVELKEYIAKFPSSDLVPAAMLALGQALRDSGQRDGAIAIFKELADKHPKSEAAPFGFFQHAAILHSEQKYDDLKTVMRDFITKYPDHERVFAAYDYMAQIEGLQQKQPEKAVATYEEFASKFPESPSAPTAIVKVSDLWKKKAEAMGRYLTIPERDRDSWREAYDKSVASAEKVLEQYPESPDVAAALQNLLKAQDQFVKAKLKADANVEAYFTDLAKKFGDKPATEKKIKFTLAGYFYDKEDRKKAVEIMGTAFDQSLVFAPADLENYAEALIEEKKYPEADKLADKLEADYPLPKGADPKTLSRGQIEPHALALFIRAKVLQLTGKTAEAASKFAKLESEYPWSPKVIEAQYGIGLDLFEQKKYDEALKKLAPVARATTGPVKIRAQSMMLLAQVAEAQGDFDAAINNYIKIATFFEGVPELAAEGLWRGAQLQEKKARGEVKQIPKAAAPAADKPAGDGSKKVADSKPGK